MTAQIAFNPFTQTVGNAGLFSTQSGGVRQGTAYPDPSTRFRLRGGILATSETLPMWGGVGIYANVPGASSTPNPTLGTVVGRAVSLNDASKPLAGFATSDQAYNWITSPQSPVPTCPSGGTVNWYPLGSLARFAVECDPALVSLQGGPIGAQVSWDFTNQMLVPYLGTLTINSYTYNSTTGLVTLTMSSAVTFSAGDSITTAGLNISGVNGTFTALSASGTTVTYTAPTSLAGSASGGGTLTVGGAASQALPVKVLDVMASNCETITYNSTTNAATYSYNGACAIIQL
jgi:hypothetical protein